MKCKACGHPKVDELDKRLIIGETRNSLSKEFQLDPQTVLNHLENHVPPKLQSAYKLRKIQPLGDFLNEMRIRAEAVLRQAVPCQELDGTDDPGGVEIPPIDFELTPLNEIANFFKAQVLLNELIGRTTGELSDGSTNGHKAGIRLTIMLPPKVEAGGTPSDLMEYRRGQDGEPDMELDRGPGLDRTDVVETSLVTQNHVDRE